jgi:hypothetical protein
MPVITAPWEVNIGGSQFEVSLYLKEQAWHGSTCL